MPHLLSSLLLALAAPTDITGVYEVSGAPSDVFIVLHERAEGELIGYIAGSPTVWIESGQRYGSSAILELQGNDGDSDEPWSALLRLRINGRTLEGVLLQEDGVIPLTLVRSNLRFSNETWLWFDMSQNAMHDVSRLRDLGGGFIGGGFNSSGSCMFMACGGSIDSWQETAGSHDIWTSSNGGCGQTGHLVGVFDTSTNQLDGTWDSTDCNSNSSSGSFLGGKAGATYGKHTQALLLSLGTFADDFEAESMDAADVFHTNYLSDGTTRFIWEGYLSAWYATYDDIEVEISGPDEIITVIHSDVHPYLLGDARTAWTIRASGVHGVTGATETFYERVEPVVLGPDLRFLGVENGRVVFIGNGETQPLSIGFPVDLSDLSTTENPVWPFGVHGGGHADDGHPGIDFTFTAATAEVFAVEDGVIIDVRDNETFLNQVDVIQEIRTGVTIQYGHINDPAQVSIGDVLAKGDVVGNPGDCSDPAEPSRYVIHFALSFSNVDDACPVPWFTPSATVDWDTVWPLSHYSEELCEPLECNERDSAPPHVATWNLEAAGSTSGPDSMLFFREDGHEHNHVYTFFDASGSVYETGVTEWMTSPTTLGLKFIADCTGNLTFAAVDVIGDEMQIKLDSMGMPTDMSGAAVYRHGEPEDPPGYTKLYVSLMNASSVRVIDLSTGFVGAPISVGVRPAHLAYSATSNEVFVGDLSANEINRISTETGELSAPVSLSQPSGCIDINPETNMVYAVETIKTGGGVAMTIYDASSGGWPKEVLLGTDLSDLRVDTTHNMVYASDNVEGITALDADTNTWASYAMSGHPHGLAVDSNANLLYVTLVQDDSIKVLDTSSAPVLSLETTINSTSAVTFSDPQWIALNSDKTKAYITNEGEDELIVLDTSDPDPANFTIMGQIDVGDGPFFITIDTESHRAYVTNLYDDSISVIDTTTDTVVRTICLSPGDQPVGLTLAH